MRNVYYSFIYTCLSAIFLVLALPDDALAHSSLEKTFPASGAELEKIPKTVEAWFDDPVTIYSNSIEIFVNGKKQIIETRNAPENDKHIIADLPESLPAGKYDVNIKVISLDGYIITEKFAFSVLEQKVKSEAIPLKLIKQTPADGEIIEDGNGKIELWFNQPPQLTAVGLFDDNQGNIPLNQPVIDPENPKHITVDIVGELRDGTYQVTWYARPAEGGDINKPDILDVFYFAVNEFTPIKEVKNGEPIKKGWFPVIGVKQTGYWLWFTGILILFGGSLIAMMTRDEPVFWKRWNQVSLYILLLSLLGTLIVTYNQKAELGQIPWSEFFALKYVWIPIIQIAMLLLGRILGKWQPLIYGGALLLLPFVAGHAAYPRYGGAVTIIVNELHLIAVSVWLGGLFAMIAIPPKERFYEYIKLTAVKFSKLAVWSLVIITLTGIYMTLKLVPSFSLASFTGSQWGKAILAKIALTLIIVILGLFQKRYLKKMAINMMGRFRTRLKVELLYSVFILIFASILVAATPTAAEQGVYLVEAPAGKSVNVKLTPFYVGVNEMTLQFDEEVENVNVNLSMPPSFNVNYDAFKINENTFKLTGNILHAAGIVMMEVKATAKNGELLEYRYRIVVPGEK